MSDAVEIIEGEGAVVLSCEHASMRLPTGWEWPDADRRLIGTHWSYDPGAAELTRELAATLGCGAVLSRFTRLLIDPNRPLDADTLFRTMADGEAILLNATLDEADRERRIFGYYAPYHKALDRAVAASPGALVFGVHSFTPVYEGQVREVEIGVLFDHDEAPARRAAEALAASGYHVRLNEPWSGRNGLMYSPQSHAERHGRLALELEVRQDLVQRPAWRAELVPRLIRALEEASGFRLRV